ncbi:MAG: UvrD-helicase domain-containing protein [Candidatus Latescibacteria bacterium]|nr:UvrD-helicase domain-containing protein [Candidatus Latescibacterota bacterium]
MKSTIDLSVLNEPQRHAVEHLKGPTLVLAGAGSGKTRVLTHKIAYLVSRGIKPWRILAVTFTNRAAREMAGRVEKLLNIPVQSLWIGTFHSICVRILRREAERWGLSRNFTIYDRDDQLAIVKKALKEMGGQQDNLTPGHLLHIIGKAKSDFVSPDEFDSFLSGPNKRLITDIYLRYEKLLKAAVAFDFDDLLARPVDMFTKHPDTLKEWQKRFSHILVDEYQDTNHTQYLLMKMLSGGSGNVTVVGDDDQSIYSWRGANVRNILEFETDFTKAATFRLEQNYRSTGIILKAANAVVAHNENRFVKKLWTERSHGAPVKILECLDDRDEAARVVDSVEQEMKEHVYSPKDFIVLYRTNAQSRSFEDVLRRRGIKYMIVGGVRFYQRKEIKDILAYLKIIVNPDDTVSFTRAVSVPKRGIGAKTIEKLEKFASEKGISIVEAAARVEEVISSGAILKKLKKFSEILQSISEMRGKTGLDEIGHALVEKTRYKDYLIEEYPDTFEDRTNNVNELITAMGEFENITEEDDLSSFLGEISLMTDVDMWDEDEGCVTLMTLHSAKGLEFPSVYIAGVEKGLFPLPKSFDSDAELEEERRLFYVGMTRAEERLHISYAENRMRFGGFSSGGASMFVNELPDDGLEFEEINTTYKLSNTLKNQPVRRPMEFEDYSQEGPDYGDAPFEIGAFVRHPVFGRGRVAGYSGSGDKLTLTIHFGTQTKKIRAKFGKLVPA